MAEQITLQLATVLGAGMASQWIAWRLRLPAIVLLLRAGVLMGPVLGLLQPDAMFGRANVFQLAAKPRANSDQRSEPAGRVLFATDLTYSELAGGQSTPKKGIAHLVPAPAQAENAVETA